MHISYSALRDFKVCPKQYRLKYAVKVPNTPEREKKTFAGIIVADTVEQFYKQKWWRWPNDAEEKMRQYAVTRAEGRTRIKSLDWTPTEWKEVIDLIFETLPKVLAVIKAEKLLGRRNEVEHEATYEIEDNHGEKHTLHGRMDLISWSLFDDGITLVDGKMGATVGKFVSTDQLRLYALMAHREFGVYPKRVGFWWFRHSKVVWKKITAAALDKFKDGMRNTLTRLKGGESAPTPGTHCRICDFRTECVEGKKYLFDKEASRCPLDIPAGKVTFGSFD